MLVRDMLANTILFHIAFDRFSQVFTRGGLTLPDTKVISDLLWSTNVAKRPPQWILYSGVARQPDMNDMPSLIRSQ